MLAEFQQALADAQSLALGRDHQHVREPLDLIDHQGALVDRVLDQWQTGEVADVLNHAVGATSHFTYGFTFARIRRKGSMTPRQRRRRERIEATHGRPDPKAIERTVPREAARARIDAIAQEQAQAAQEPRALDVAEDQRAAAEARRAAAVGAPTASHLDLRVERLRLLAEQAVRALIGRAGKHNAATFLKGALAARRDGLAVRRTVLRDLRELR